MCGLAGIWVVSPRGDIETVMRRMTETLHHRGPDDGGVWVTPERDLALGHRRLAIIDLSAAGAQPMHSACGRHVLAFNGEIYNHQALRRGLEAAGRAPVWRGASDTETLLAAIAAWGVVAALERAVGMFALAVWDRERRCLTLARDRFGEKPLYYGWTGSGPRCSLVFGSELKALRAFPDFAGEVNRGSLALFMQFSAVPAPHSIFRGIFKLDPGSILTVDAAILARGEAQPERYWRIEDVARRGIAEPFVDPAEAVETLEAALGEAVALQMVADVPVGAFLSGGIDSSTIAALMQIHSTRPISTFTVGFEDPAYDEAPHAAGVARHLGTEHHEFRMTAADALAIIPQLPSIYDEPFADSSQIPTLLVCGAARSLATVVLTGDGGDELFGGYLRYFWPEAVWRRYERLPPLARRLLGRAIEAVPGPLVNGLLRRPDGHEKALRLARRLRTVGSRDDLYRSLVCEWYGDDLPVLALGTAPSSKIDEADLMHGIEAAEHRMMVWDALSYLPDDILTKVDRAAMAVSLETRLPLLDHRVAEAAWRIPFGMTFGSGKSKPVLRAILDRHVSRELIDRPKSGFGIPLGNWLRGPLRDWAEDLLDEARLASEGFLDARQVRIVWTEHLLGGRDRTVRLWNMLMFQAWLRERQSDGVGS